MLRPALLIIKDDQKLNHMFCKHLGHAGYLVSGAYSLTEAYQFLLNCQPPDLIVIDQPMLDEQNTQLLSLLNQADFARTRVVVLSNDSYSAHELFTQIPINHVLVKPVTPHDITALA